MSEPTTFVRKAQKNSSLLAYAYAFYLLWFQCFPFLNYIVVVAQLDCVISVALCNMYSSLGDCLLTL